MNKVILITGGSASGKTTVALEFVKKFKSEAIWIAQDNFYFSTGNPHDNYDLPSAFDFKLQLKTIMDLVEGKSVQIPQYNFAKYKAEGSILVKPAPLIILEGIFAAYDPKIRQMASLSIFVDTPSDIRLLRRIKRDIATRDYDLAKIEKRWNQDVQPAYQRYIKPLKYKSDIVLPWTSVNKKGINALFITLTHI